MKNNKILSLTKKLSICVFITFSITYTLSAEPVKIMLLGDSITEGGGHIPQYPDSNISIYNGMVIQNPNQISYRGNLWSLLINEGYTFGKNAELDFVGSRNSGSNYIDAFDMDHQGVSGATSYYISEHIQQWLNENPSDIVLLHIGTNDPGHGINIGTYDDIDQDRNTTVNNVKKILNTIFLMNPNAKVFVARIIEARRAHNFTKLPNWRTVNLNNKIVEMINNHNKRNNIKIVDMENEAGIVYNPCGTTLGDMQPFHGESLKEYDFHPNKNGYQKIAQKWFDELISSDWLPNTDSVNENWFTYNESKRTVVVSLSNSGNSILKSEGLPIIFDEEGNNISLIFKEGGVKAYLNANKNGEMTTGFFIADDEDKTLAVFPISYVGIKLLITKDKNKIIIERNLKLEKNEFFIIGGL